MLVIRLLACCLGIAAAVPPGQRCRLTHRILHRLLACLGVLLTVYLVHGVAGHIIAERLAAQYRVEHVLELLLVARLECRRLLGNDVIQLRHGRAHILGGLVAVRHQAAKRLLGLVGYAGKAHQRGCVAAVLRVLLRCAHTRYCACRRLCGLFLCLLCGLLHGLYLLHLIPRHRLLLFKQLFIIGHSLTSQYVTLSLGSTPPLEPILQ